mmetsp:Transcript_6787/g.14864  ORF Transcript_6787/g.14864 Transcript_6787/m.14864 type:complete len:125 (+) Transcript_6787:617-991(+)
MSGSSVTPLCSAASTAPPSSPIRLLLPPSPPPPPPPQPLPRPQSTPHHRHHRYHHRYRHHHHHSLVVAQRCSQVSTLITEKAVFDVVDETLVLREIGEGETVESVRAATAADFVVADDVGPMRQ